MKYFIKNSERQGTCYFEFQKGEFNGKFWLEDSLFLDEDIFDKFELYKYFQIAVPEFDYYGMNNAITPEQWKKLVSLIPKNSKQEELFDKLTVWVNDTLEEYGTFSILGI